MDTLEQHTVDCTNEQHNSPFQKFTPEDEAYFKEVCKKVAKDLQCVRKKSIENQRGVDEMNRKPPRLI